ARITIVMMTDGAETRALIDQPEEYRRSVRLGEAREVASDLGATLVPWKEPDSALACEPKNVERLAELLDRLRPRMIFVPFVNDFHPDHVAANRILAAALEKSSLESKDVSVLAYEVWAFAPVNLVSEFDGRLFDQKARLLMKYRTGMKVKDYVGFCRTLNAYHAHMILNRKGFAEGFLSMDAGEYCTLIEG
ncbi:MAG: PIG-L family deacetylase, partial [bacterium]